MVPEAVIPRDGARIIDLQDPTAKMSKSADSRQGASACSTTRRRSRKKFMRAVTDSEPRSRYDRADKPGVSNRSS